MDVAIAACDKCFSAGLVSGASHPQADPSNLSVSTRSGATCGWLYDMARERSRLDLGVP